MMVKTGDPSNTLMATVGEEIPKGFSGVDIGPKTLASFSEALEGMKSLFWNGPMGIYEQAPSAQGTQKLAALIAKRTQEGMMSIAGGGDVVSAIEACGLAKQFSFVSTGGGATLDYLRLGTLPGLDALSQDDGPAT